MSILSRLTYSLEVKLNMFLQAFKLERRIEDPELQVDALLETSSAKMKTRNRAAIGRLIDTLKFLGQLGIPFRGHRDNDRLESVSDIKDIDTSTRNFRAILWETPNSSHTSKFIRRKTPSLPYTSKNLLLMQHI